ncbi:MAG TPA: hypothetical protein VEA41_09190 [Salinarimonas sp.]|nr:hypothetical protein [Salinarimonas sp.]
MRVRAKAAASGMRPEILVTLWTDLGRCEAWLDADAAELLYRQLAEAVEEIRDRHVDEDLERRAQAAEDAIR